MKEYKTLTPHRGLCIDWESSGADFGGKNAEKYQGISVGAIIFDTKTFAEIDRLYLEIQFDASKYSWAADAQNIHGLSREYLAANGLKREDACLQLAEFFLKYFGPNAKIVYAGHNTIFDIEFTEQLFNDFGLELSRYHVMIDTAPLSLIAFGTHKSNHLFEIMGLTERQNHNAMEDASMTLQVLRDFRSIFNEIFAE
jgi:DNA polymerase III alpha subunit (gram-positive type)